MTYFTNRDFDQMVERADGLIPSAQQEPTRAQEQTAEHLAELHDRVKVIGLDATGRLAAEGIDDDDSDPETGYLGMARSVTPYRIDEDGRIER